MSGADSGTPNQVEPSLVCLGEKVAGVARLWTDRGDIDNPAHVVERSMFIDNHSQPLLPTLSSHGIGIAASVESMQALLLLVS
jgi:hypothetical protein